MIVSVVVLLDDVFLTFIFLALPTTFSLEVRDQVSNFLAALLFRFPLALKVQARVLACVDRRLPVNYRGLVVHILLEELLYAISAEKQRVFLHDILILPIIIIYMLLVEVVFLGGGYVGADQPLLEEGRP